MSTTMVMPVTCSLKPETLVSKMVKVGDHVNAGDNVIVFSEFSEDEDVRTMLQGIAAEFREQIIESNSTTKKTHYTGTVVDIDVISTVELDKLSDSLRKIVSDHWKKIKKRDKILNKYRNSDDVEFYKSGNVITSTAAPVKPDYQGKVRGNYVHDGVLITFYIAFKDVMSRGDKEICHKNIFRIIESCLDNQ